MAAKRPDFRRGCAWQESNLRKVPARAPPKPQARTDPTRARDSHGKPMERAKPRRAGRRRRAVLADRLALPAEAPPGARGRGLHLPDRSARPAPATRNRSSQDGREGSRGRDRHHARPRLDRGHRPNEETETRHGFGVDRRRHGLPAGPPALLLVARLPGPGNLSGHQGRQTPRGVLATRQPRSAPRRVASLSAFLRRQGLIFGPRRRSRPNPGSVQWVFAHSGPP
jgi:hypothetical protein